MNNRLGVAAILALGLVWGYNWVVIKVATADASPFVLVALRAVIGSLALFAIVAILRKPLRPPHFGWTLAIGLLQIAGLTLLQTLALASGGAGKVTVLVYTFPIWIIVLSAVLLNEPLTRRRLLVAAIAIAGLAFVLAPLDVTHAPISIVFALGSALSWALGAVLTKKFRARHDVDLLSFTAWQMAYGAVPLVIVAAFVPGGFVHPTATFFAAFAYIVVLGTALAFALWFFILQRYSAATAGIASLLAPVVSVLAAWAQLHEEPSITETIGIALILAALAVNTIPKRIATRRAAAAA